MGQELKQAIKSIKNEVRIPNDKDLILVQAIDQIKNTFLKDWKDEHFNIVNKFLAAVKNGFPTPTLSVCGRGTQEIRFTKYLAYYLDPAKNHGMKEIFLHEIFNDVLRKNGFPIEWLDHCHVDDEVRIGSVKSEKDKEVNCFCDISIVGENYAIFIEQKVLSNESSNDNSDLGQLERYSLCLAECNVSLCQDTKINFLR